MKKILKREFNKGFTMVEVLVAMTLFVVIVSATTVSFITAMKTQRQLVSLMAATDSASLAIEQMAKEIRTGRDFCRTSCADGIINFTTWKGEAVTYQVDANKQILRSSGINSGPITADNVSIERLNFIISGNQPTDDYPPRITIILRAAVPQTGPIGIRGVYTDLQTTISARNPEI